MLEFHFSLQMASPSWGQGHCQNKGPHKAIVEHRPDFNNALTLGALPSVKTDPVKERNFLKWNFLLRKRNVPPRDPLTKISLCNITSKYTENFLEGLYVHANWQSTMIINLLRVWWRRSFGTLPGFSVSATRPLWPLDRPLRPLKSWKGLKIDPLSILMWFITR